MSKKHGTSLATEAPLFNKEGTCQWHALLLETLLLMVKCKPEGKLCLEMWAWKSDFLFLCALARSLISCEMWEDMQLLWPSIS